MILPLLCASLLVSAAVAPAVLPQNEDFDCEFSSGFVRLNKVVDSSGEVTYNSFEEIYGLSDLDVIISLPFGDYFDDVGESHSIENLSENPSVEFSYVYFIDGNPDTQTLHLTIDEISSVDGEDFFSIYSIFDASQLDSEQTFHVFELTLNFSEYSIYFTCHNRDFIFYDGVLSPQFNADNNDYDLVPPSPSVDGVEIVGEIVSILGAGIGQLGSSIGQGIATFAQSLAFDGNGNLSIYFIMVISLASVSLAIALTSRLFTWLTTLGN